MKKIFFLICLSGSFSACLFGQTDSLKNKETKDYFLTGEIIRAQLQQDSMFSGYFSTEYNYYEPNLTVLNDLQPEIFLTSITIVLGTWCHDSKEQVPRFYNILDKINYNTDTIKLIGVDKNKSAGDIDLQGLNIQLVPTFIFYQNGAELGRIIETPKRSLEYDLLEILKSR